MSKLLYIIGCTIVAVLIIVYGNGIFTQKQKVVVTEFKKETPAHTLDKGELGAAAAFAQNLKNDQMLIGVHEEAQLPLASLAKVATAIVALEYLPGTSSIVITQTALDEEGASGLVLGEEWRRDDLVAFMLVASSNDAARALAIEIEKRTHKPITELMNAYVENIGLAQTFYYNPTGLDMGTKLAGGYGSARDQTLLLSYAFNTYPDIFEKTTHKEERFRTNLAEHVAINTNPSVEEFSGLRASKTGSTDLAGGNLALLYDLYPGLTVISAVLGSTEIGRFVDSKNILRTLGNPYIHKIQPSR